MSLSSAVTDLATRIATEFNTVRTEIASLGGGGGPTTIDGGNASTVYGSARNFNGGDANG